MKIREFYIIKVQCDHCWLLCTHPDDSQHSHRRNKSCPVSLWHNQENFAVVNVVGNDKKAEFEIN